MTLILTRACNSYVLQVTDRLLTHSGGIRFDELSNKNVVCHFSNAIATFGYTGFAYLRGTPTDQWIVETLTGHTFPAGFRPPALRSGRLPRAWDIGRSLTFLKRELEKAPVENRFQSAWKAKSFDVCVAGWQWSRKCVRPVLAWLSKAENSLSVELSYMPRYWHWQRNDRGLFITKHAAAPSDNITREQLKALVEELAGSDEDQAERTMADFIRKISQTVPEVGPHCMSVLFRPPSVASARVRYIHRGDAVVAVLSSHGSTFVVPTAFTPWIVGPEAIFAPSINSGNSQIQLGHYVVSVEAPESPGPGIRALTASQRRPKAP